MLTSRPPPQSSDAACSYRRLGLHLYVRAYRAGQQHCAPEHVQDMFTSLTSASKPHHMMSGSGVILGYSHFGMLAAARWVMQQTQERLREAMEGSPGYHLQIVGHSLGAGTAALLTTRQAPVQARSEKRLLARVPHNLLLRLLWQALSCPLKVAR